jgi:hypothetical protein
VADLPHGTRLAIRRTQYADSLDVDITVSARGGTVRRTALR